MSRRRTVPTDGDTPTRFAGPRRQASIALSLAGAAVIGGCGQPVELLPRYHDLVAGPGLTSTVEGGEPAQLVCADETYFSRPLRPGEELSAAVEFGAEPRLLVSGCLAGGAAAGPGAAEAAVTIAAESLGGRAIRVTLPAGDGRGWWRTEIDLAELSGTTGRIRVISVLPPKAGTLLLRDLALAHRVPAVHAPRVSSDGGRGGRRRQVLLISIDALRADFVGVLGGPVATPAIDSLAADGETFTPHYATGSWTKPSHAGLLTGEQAAVCGAASRDDPIRTGVTTLAERFRQAGFLTAGLVHDCVWLNPKFGFARGFDSYRTVKWGTGPLVREAVNWMASHRDQPFFYFLHTFDVHSDFAVLPYEAPGVSRATVEERFGVADYGCSWGHCATNLLEQLDSGALPPQRWEAEILRFLYGKGVAGVDAELATLFADLRALDLYDGMTIALTSDHGESLLEHGRTLHGTWWQQVLEVPLIVKWPEGERAGGRRLGASSAIDLAPTLLASVGVDPGDLPGIDLRSRPAGRPVLVDGPDWQAIVVGSLKGVVGVRETGPQLYDLAADPAEERNVVGERTAEAEMLAARLAELRRAGERRAARLGVREVPTAARLSDDERERLRALGYLGE